MTFNVGKERNWMKIRSAGGVSAGALALFLALGAAGCGKDNDNANNANNSNAARNANAVATATATPTPVTTSEDTAIKNKTEAALSKAGVSGVTVEVKGGEVTLKGDLAKAKWPDAMKAANESGAKKVNNQLNDKK
jgi:osmotically-inducible protein OsmY